MVSAFNIGTYLSQDYRFAAVIGPLQELLWICVTQEFLLWQLHSAVFLKQSMKNMVVTMLMVLHSAVLLPSL
jgi:hypothetical protein